ncbi:HNH endonuclease [Rubellimicrobium arenae]|uniref:HNH endonuclease n=1 Tax=Rubellimicrobium arenae TaxID=2817372 RepID=UPI001B313DAE|nr:HNH endonuclease signature motif containing protein [Rubellimicrobium arenae]
MTTEFRSSPLTDGNFKAARITITPFLSQLPTDVIGGSDKARPAPRRLKLHWGQISTEADLPTERHSGRPRGFMRERGEFTKAVLAEAAPGDVVVFQQIGPYEYRLMVEKPDGRRVTPSQSDNELKERVRRWAMRETRPEQQNFRRQIAERDGLRCAVTGCAIPEVLDAAHIAQRATGGPDDPRNGMILRADVHRLFDAGLLTIDPATRTVVVLSVVDDATYRDMCGRVVSTKAHLGNLPPSSEMPA